MTAPTLPRKNNHRGLEEHAHPEQRRDHQVDVVCYAYERCGEAGAVAIFTEQVLTGVRPTILGDGGKTRDYVFVEDIARANLLAVAGRAIMIS